MRKEQRTKMISAGSSEQTKAAMTEQNCETDDVKGERGIEQRRDEN